MDFKDQLKNLFPDHVPAAEQAEDGMNNHELYIQKEPVNCHYEKRNGKPTTVIDGYDGSSEDFKILTKSIKTKFSVGGSFKDNQLIIQGNYRDKIMDFLKDKGFKVKRVGG